MLDERRPEEFQILLSSLSGIFKEIDDRLHAIFPILQEHRRRFFFLAATERTHATRTDLPMNLIKSLVDTTVDRALATLAGEIKQCRWWVNGGFFY